MVATAWAVMATGPRLPLSSEGPAGLGLDAPISAARSLGKGPVADRRNQHKPGQTQAGTGSGAASELGVFGAAAFGFDPVGGGRFWSFHGPIVARDGITVPIEAG